MKYIGNIQSQANAEVFAVASGALPDGKPVIVNSNGTVSLVAATNISESLGSSAQANSSEVIHTGTAYDETSQKIVMVYCDYGNSTYGTAVVGTVSGTSISFGTPVVYEASKSFYNRVVYDPDSEKVVIAYAGTTNQRGYARVGTVSGTSISFGTRAQFETGSIKYTAQTYDTTSNKVIIAYQDDSNGDGGTAVVGTVSGTDISFGTPVVFNELTTLFTDVAHDSVADRTVITYKNSGNSNYGTAIVGTVSGTGISFGTAVVFESDVTNNTSVAYDPVSGNVLVTYGDVGNNSKGTAIVGSVSGTSISFGSPVVFSTPSTSRSPSVFMSNTQNMIVAIQSAGSPGGTVKTATITGTSVSFGSAFTFDSDDVTWVSVAYNPDGNNLVIGYSDYGGSTRNAMSAVVYQNPYTVTNVTTENFLGFTNAAYADTQTATIQAGGAINTGQSSLTIGQQYFVQKDGTIGTTAAIPSVIAGTAVSATDLIVKG